MTRPWNPEFSHCDRERWICIYPIYLNSKRTLTEGRTMPLKYCIDNPKLDEIRDVLLETGLQIGVEDKVHPKVQDSKELKSRGRIRVQLKNDDGLPVLEHLPSRMALLRYLGEMIPKLKSRQNTSHCATNDTSNSKKNKKRKK